MRKTDSLKGGIEGKVAKLKAIVRNNQEGVMDSPTVSYLCECLDSFSTTSTFLSYFSALRIYLKWCLKGGLVPM